MAQMTSTLLGGSDLFLTVNSAVLPTQAEWDDYMNYTRSIFERRGHRRLYVLVYSLGGAPNARQRQQLADATPPGARGKVALVTTSQFVRMVSKALPAIHEIEYRTYLPEELRRALKWLGVKTLSETMIRSEINRLLDELGLSHAALPVGRS